jgi:hypothetical protein
MHQEQAEYGNSTVQADVWAIGKILFALVTITLDMDNQQCYHAHPDTHPQFPGEQQALYPPEMLEIMMQCLQLQPSDRPT